MARITLDGTGDFHPGTIADLRVRLLGGGQPHEDGAADHEDAELVAAQARTAAARDGMIARLRNGWKDPDVGTTRLNVREKVHNLAAELRGA